MTFRPPLSHPVPARTAGFCNARATTVPRGEGLHESRQVDKPLESGLQCSSGTELLKMPENSVVRARIDERTKDEAAAVLSSIGLTVSDAFRLLLVRIAREKALPFEPLVPNSKTIAAMRAARRGAVKTVGRVKDLLTDLNAED